MTSGVILEFGSRSGSWFALGLFTLMFGTLGWGVAREIRLRSKDSGVALALGLALFVGPVVMVYANSLSGFYEAQIDGEMLRLHYLFPRVVTEIALADVVTARSIPAIRGRQRLQIIDRLGRDYESATWHRDSIAQSLARLKELLPKAVSGRTRVEFRPAARGGHAGESADPVPFPGQDPPRSSGFDQRQSNRAIRIAVLKRGSGGTTIYDIC